MATTRVKKDVALARLALVRWMIVDDWDSRIYVDADCTCCGSRYKVGELDVADGTVDGKILHEIVNSEKH